MQFSTFALTALSIGSALAQSTGSVVVHVVKVGSANGTLAYFPNSITANKGDMVQFQFAPNNHTVTQSTFDQPCQPISLNSNVTGFYSGFMPVSATSTTTPTYTIMINSTTPTWIYCSQGKHCQAGMVMVINQNTTANATRSIQNFAALAAKATVNLPGTAVEGGASGTNSTSTSSSSGTSTSGTGSGTGTGTGTSAGSSTSSSASAKASSPAMTVRASQALGLGSLVAVVFAVFL